MGNLSPAQTEDLKNQLTRRKAELVGEIELRLADAKTERVAPDAVSTTDGGDKALLESASGLDLAIVRRDVDELRGVERALARFEDGSFGACADCGNAIAPERLLAYPAAIRCASCQTETERRGGVTHTPRR
jgi:DnaK suppressor protein